VEGREGGREGDAEGGKSSMPWAKRVKDEGRRGAEGESRRSLRNCLQEGGREGGREGEMSGNR